jgi:hypothetical protein
VSCDVGINHFPEPSRPLRQIVQTLECLFRGMFGGKRMSAVRLRNRLCVFPLVAIWKLACHILILAIYRTKARTCGDDGRPTSGRFSLVGLDAGSLKAELCTPNFEL